MTRPDGSATVTLSVANCWAKRWAPNNEANPRKPATSRKITLFTSSPTLTCRPLVRRRASPQSHSVSEWVKPYLRSPDGDNTRKRLEIETAQPVYAFRFRTATPKENCVQSVKQEPIHLPGVENNPRPSHYLNLIRTSQSTGRETTQTS